MYYVYVDRTADYVPFYVGMGNQARLKLAQRNRFWQNIAAKYGWNPDLREVVLITSVQQSAFELEIELIEELGTYYYANKNLLACNFTRGGPGARGVVVTDTPVLTRYVKKSGPHGNLGKRRSTEWKKLHSGSNNAFFGGTHSTELKEKFAKAYAGQGNPRARLTQHDVDKIRARYSEENVSLFALAKEFGVQQPAIFKIVHHLTWKEKS